MLGLPSLKSSSNFRFSLPLHLVSRDEVKKNTKRVTLKQALVAVSTNPTTTAATAPERLNDRYFHPYNEMRSERPRAHPKRGHSRRAPNNSMLWPECVGNGRQTKIKLVMIINVSYAHIHGLGSLSFQYACQVSSEIIYDKLKCK